MSIKNQAFGIGKSGRERGGDSARRLEAEEIALVRFENVARRCAPVRGKEWRCQNRGGEEGTEKSRFCHGVLVQVPGNVPSDGRSSTFEYRKRKKPRALRFVAQAPAQLSCRKSPHSGSFQAAEAGLLQGPTAILRLELRH